MDTSSAWISCSISSLVYGFPKPTADYDDYQRFNRFLLVDDIDGVKVITIRRPQVANALSDYTCNEILAELKKGEADPSVRGFVITGYGLRAFCAGADLSAGADTFAPRDASTFSAAAIE